MPCVWFSSVNVETLLGCVERASGEHIVAAVVYASIPAPRKTTVGEFVELGVIINIQSDMAPVNIYVCSI